MNVLCDRKGKRNKNPIKNSVMHAWSKKKALLRIDVRTRNTTIRK